MSEAQEGASANGCFYNEPTLMERFWRKVGFHYHLGDEPQGAESLPGWSQTNQYFHFGWSDRLRLLISGRLLVKLTMSTDTPSPSVCKNRMDWMIYAPGQKR